MYTTAILLVAGRARGRAQPRPLRKQGGVARLETAVDEALRSCVDEVVVVLGRRVASAQGQLEARPRLRVVIDKAHSEKRTALMTAGIRNASPETTAYFVSLGDDRAPSSLEIDRFLAAALRGGKPIAVRGDRRRRDLFPMLFERSVRAELLADLDDEGLRRIVEGDPSRLCLVRGDRGAPTATRRSSRS